MKKTGRIDQAEATQSLSESTMSDSRPPDVMAPHANSNGTTVRSRTARNHRPQTRATIPALWLEEVTGPSPKAETVAVPISWNPKTNSNRLEDSGVDPEQLEEDFRNGFSVIKRHHEQDQEVFDLVSSRFCLRVGLVRGEDSGVPLARFLRCSRNERSSPPGLLRGRLSFEAIWDEVECDLERLAAAEEGAFQDLRAHRIEQDKVREQLEAIPDTRADPLAELARTKLRSLVALLNLFEKRHQDQPGKAVAATVVQPADSGLQDQATQAEDLDGHRLQISLDPGENDFEQGRILEFRGATQVTGTWERARITSAEGRHLELDIFSGNLPAEKNIKIRLYQRFDRKNHQIALDRFLREDTIGHWPALVRLVTSPQDLPRPTPEAMSQWFNKNLNDEQRRAVTGAVSAPFAFFIQGPPGTGKSTVISEIVQQLTARGERVLLVAPTHVAVDAVLEKIGNARNIFAVRLAREEEDVSPKLRRFHEKTVSQELEKSVRRRENAQAPVWMQQLTQFRREQILLRELYKALEERDNSARELAKSQEERAQWEIKAGLELSTARELALAAEQAVLRARNDLDQRIVRYQEANSLLQAAEARATSMAETERQYNIGALAMAKQNHEKAANDLAKAESEAAALRNELQERKRSLGSILDYEKAWLEKLGRMEAAVTEASKRVAERSAELTKRVNNRDLAKSNHAHTKAQANFLSSIGDWIGVGSVADARHAYEQAESAYQDAYRASTNAQQELDKAQQTLSRAKDEWRSWQPVAERDKSLLPGEIARLAGELKRRVDPLEKARKHAEQCAQQLDRTRIESLRLRNLLRDFQSGSLTNARNACEEATSARGTAQNAFTLAEGEQEARRKELQSLSERQSASRATNDQLLDQQSELVRTTEKAWEKASDPIPDGKSLTIECISTRLNDLAEREQETSKWLQLEEEWLEATSELPQAEIGRQLLCSANLICATTVAIGSHPMITGRKGADGEHIDGDWTEFDTLIVDEASRVTDAEFMIGAVRSRRWILVGDEHQLPPYVEQDEEHFLHALVALRMAEQGTPPDVKNAIEQLEDWWEEDEELRQFRRDSVLKQVGALLDLDPAQGVEGIETQIEGVRHDNRYQAGRWETTYRGLVEEIADSIEYTGAEEKNRELVRLMIQFMVRSLFERCLDALSPESPLCQKLVVQRRMLASIAELVREPIYAGNYASPAAEDLGRHGLFPFGFGKPFDGDLVFLDTSLQKNPWQRQSGNGFDNSLECDWILKTCRRLDDELARRGETESVSVTILCFYQAQVKRIWNRVQAEHRREPFRVLNLFEHERVRAVPIDRIQGQESDIVFISFVRTYGYNPPTGFGIWLQDYRRLNVACTRAHRMLVMVGHRTTLEQMGRNSSLQKAKAFYANLFNLLDGGSVASERSRFVKHL